MALLLAMLVADDDGDDNGVSSKHFPLCEVYFLNLMLLMVLPCLQLIRERNSNHEIELLTNLDTRRDISARFANAVASKKKVALI